MRTPPRATSRRPPLPLAAELGGPGHVGAVGFCYGGMLAAALASRAPAQLAAAVAYYPIRWPPSCWSTIDPHVPLLVHLGRHRHRASRPPTATRSPPAGPPPSSTTTGAGHGFNCDLRADFDAA